MPRPPLAPGFDTIDLAKALPTTGDDELARQPLPAPIAREHAMRIARFCLTSAQVERRRRGEPFAPMLDTPWEERTEAQRSSAAVAVVRVVQALQVLGYLA